MTRAGGGVAYGLGAYFLWGILPLFWILLDGLKPEEILCHRAIWSFLIVSVILFTRGKLKPGQLKVIPLSSLALVIAGAICIGLNWFINVAAVNSGQVIECSLGYYINPVFSLFLGVFFLGEKLRGLQIVAVILVTSGVLILILLFGETPWIALSLTLTFGFYGMFKKMVTMDATLRLWIEVAVLTLFAMPFLVYMECTAQCQYFSYNSSSQWLLICSGVATVLPLIMFAKALDRLSLSSMGVLQYLAPTLQLLTGIFAFNESLSPGFMTGLLFIWAGIIAYSLHGTKSKQSISKHLSPDGAYS